MVSGLSVRTPRLSWVTVETAPAMAVANDITVQSKLSGGESIKISKRERYQTAP